MNLLRPCKYSSTNSYSPFNYSNYHKNSNNNNNNLDEARIINTIQFHRRRRRPNNYGTKNVGHFVKKVPSLIAYSKSNNEEGGENSNEEDNTQRKTFLSLEEAGLVEMSGLSTHERFLCRLTISSLNLLRVVAEQEMCSIEELNAGRICDWFLKDKLKREQNIGSAVLQWDDDDPFQGQF